MKIQTLFVLSLAAFAAVLLWPSDVEAAPTGTTCTGALCQVDATGDLRVDAGAATSTWEYPWQPGVAVTTYPAAQVLDGAKALCVHNRSSGTCYWRPSNANVDPSGLTTTGSTGEQFPAGEYRCFDQATARFLTGSTAACTAAATSTAPLMTRQWK
jgi:hypothetical protein